MLLVFTPAPAKSLANTPEDCLGTPRTQVGLTVSLGFDVE